MPKAKKEKSRLKSPSHASETSVTGSEEGAARRKRKRFAENIEAPDEETEKQAMSSWAQRQGLPSKPGAVMNHGINIQRNQNEAIAKMQQRAAKVT